MGMDARTGRPRASYAVMAGAALAIAFALPPALFARYLGSPPPLPAFAAAATPAVRLARFVLWPIVRGELRLAVLFRTRCPLLGLAGRAC